VLIFQDDWADWKKEVLVYGSITCSLHSMIKFSTQSLRTEGYRQVYPDMLHASVPFSVPQGNRNYSTPHWRSHFWDCKPL